jgi:predicted O-methyltransferase YrrM
MFNTIISYLTFLLESKTKYGIHSPFVYDFVTKGLEVKVSKEVEETLRLYREALLSSPESISVTDFGAGSKVFKSNKRQISKIAKYAGISSKKAKLLQRIVCYLKPHTILEMGTSVGIGAAAMASVANQASIISLEGCPETAGVAKRFLKKQYLDKVQITVGEFSKTLPETLQSTNFDLIYFDGNHQEQPTMTYFEMALEHIHNESVFIFDDIHWSKGMEAAWGRIKKNNKVSVTIDLFHMGLVFFRKEQVKQDFIIRT